MEHWGTLFSRTKDGKIAQNRSGEQACPGLVMLRIGRVIVCCTLFTTSDRPFRFRLRGVGCPFSPLWTREDVRVPWPHFSRKITPIQAKAVILATGGYGRTYLRSTNRHQHRKGCFHGLSGRRPLEDMEFVQFHRQAFLEEHSDYRREQEAKEDI